MCLLDGDMPSWLQTTLAALLSQKSLHTVPHVLLKHISTRPSVAVVPLTSRSCLSSHWGSGERVLYLGLGTEKYQSSGLSWSNFGILYLMPGTAAYKCFFLVLRKCNPGITTHACYNGCYSQNLCNRTTIPVKATEGVVSYLALQSTMLELQPCS